MGELAEELKNLIRKRVEDRGIVVWYDPEGIYARVFEELDGEGLQKFRYDGSFFALRREADPLLESSPRPKAVIYVPLGREAAGYALVELESAGDAVYPGGTTGRNTKLEVITRAVLKKHLPEAKVEAVCRQVAERKLSLEEIESVIEEAKRVVPETLKLVFGTGDPSELALKFVSGDGYDANILEKNASSELASLLASDFGLELAAEASPRDMRKELQRSALLGEFISNLEVEVPKRLSGYIPKGEKAKRDALLKLAERWRKRSDLKGAYEEAADLTERDYDIGTVKATDIKSGAPVTFRATAANILRHAADLILEGKIAEARVSAQRLTEEFWYESDARIALKCNLLLHVCALIQKCADVLKEIKKPRLAAEAMVERYAAGDNPWFELDRLQRETEQRYEKYDIDDEDDGGGLEKVMAKARQAFSETVGSMAERFQSELQKALGEGGFSFGRVLLQRELFKKVVEPLGRPEGKLAFMCVDALRYEMASELARELAKRHEVDLTCAVATLPSVTGVGMAALLPGAEQSISLAFASGGVLGLDVNGRAIINREERVNHLKDKLGGKITALALEDLQKLSKKTKDTLQEASFVYVTSQEIDSTCEMGNDSLARDIMGELIARLRRAIKSLVSCGFDKIVITADHGYLFGEEVESGMKIDAPGGKTAVLKQRVWIGEGGAAGDAFLRLKEMDLGLDGGYELAFPRGVASFKVKGGGKSYFHGGISLQEMVIPVLTLLAGEEPAARRGKKPAISLSMDRKKVGRYFKVKVGWIGQASLMEEEMRLTAVLKIAGEERGKAVAASYGFDESSGEFTIKGDEENIITIIVDEDVTGEHSGSVHVVNPETKAEVAVLEDIAIDITF